MYFSHILDWLLRCNYTETVYTTIMQISPEYTYTVLHRSLNVIWQQYAGKAEGNQTSSDTPTFFNKRVTRSEFTDAVHIRFRGWGENSSKAHPITLQSFLKIEPSQSPLSYLFCNSNVSIQLTKLLRTFGFQSLWNNLIVIWKLNCIDKLNNTPSFRTRANESSSLRKCTRVQKLCFYPFLKPVSRKCLHMNHDLPGALLCSRTAVILYVWASGLTSLTTAWISFIWERTKSTL